jgi:S1-C subfamily serine protease
MIPTKFLRYLLLLLIACSTTFAEQADGEKEEATEERKKEKAAEKKKEEEKAIKKEFAYSFNDIRDHLVVIEHENGTGSGFVAKMGDHYYIFTNQHVIFGAHKISFKSVSGKQLRPKKVELSATRDMARLLLDTDEGLAVSGNIEMDAPIALFGNSDGAGVATELYGRINGIGGELIEVSADFVSGNSGSPVLNLDQEVIGIASYVRFSVEI